MNIKELSIAGIVLLSLASCDMNRAERAVNKAFEEYHNYKPKEAEKKPAIFYQKMLEEFCLRYYHESFGRTYHSNSLVVYTMDPIPGKSVDDIVVSWNMEVRGEHSFESFLFNHNNSPFRAYIVDLGDNDYTVTFYIRKYNILGDLTDEEECATRTLTYSE